MIHHVSDRVLVMKDGRVVEQGTADEIFRAPRDPYTRRLLAAMPTLPDVDAAKDDNPEPALAA